MRRAVLAPHGAIFRVIAHVRHISYEFGVCSFLIGTTYAQWRSVQWDRCCRNSLLKTHRSSRKNRGDGVFINSLFELGR